MASSTASRTRRVTWSGTPAFNAITIESDARASRRTSWLGPPPWAFCVRMRVAQNTLFMIVETTTFLTSMSNPFMT